MWYVTMPKPKGPLGGNPCPVQTPAFIAKRFTAADVPKGIKLAKRMTAVRLPEEIAAQIDALGKQKPVWLRRVLTEAVHRELIGGDK